MARLASVGLVLLGALPGSAQQGGGFPPPSLVGAQESAARAAVKPPPRPSVESVLDVCQRAPRFVEVVVSPAGDRVAWVEVAQGGTLIQVVARGEPESRAVRVTACPQARACDESSLAWSPDGRHLAFLSDAGPSKQAQVHVVDVAGGEARRLTSFETPLASPRWSPDGKTVAVLVMQGEGAEHARGPTEAAARETGVVGESAPVQRVALVSVADGGHRFVSPEGLHVYEYAWSPEGRRLALVAAAPPGDAHWWTAKLHVVDVASGRARVVHVPKWQVAEPTWSPDGRHIAFIEGLMSDQGVTGGDVWVVTAEGEGKARDLTPGMKATASSLAWVAPRKLLFGGQVRGESAVASVDAVKGGATVLWTGPERLSAGETALLSLSRDGEVSAVVRESFTRSKNLWVGAVGEWEQLTHRDDDLGALAGAVRSVSWKSDGQEVQGWLIAPARGVAPAQGARAPMVTMIHGGPAAGVVPQFLPQVLVLASRGYYVFLPNARGSYGLGEDFVQANRRDFGFGDLRDVLAGVDAVVASAPVDPSRLGVSGWSYGGYMVMWTVTQTQRFKAAVAGAGISNWQSYYGTNRIDTWMLPYFGATLYDEPDVYSRSSPINYVKLARTPTLMLHGERDMEVPATQSHEFHRALKSLGVKAQLVVYADEGHIFRKPEHQVDRLRRTVEWFDAHLQAGAQGPARVAAPTR
ncbi:S9 family peptidase [Myxococcus sp. K15C18031901]|uniref:S9 family peptidase n=1 Tax=Myxococcus dinghuensis TaxID=2906761 RepID=UPI0020A75DAC|nr:prolyl oligopeptidase family serine peptidase [Myxococcus dinghuensis]MCP3099074.1 S9 family peptidase [Myxococcus dinghuensis]